MHQVLYTRSHVALGHHASLGRQLRLKLLRRMALHIEAPAADGVAPAAMLLCQTETACPPWQSRTVARQSHRRPAALFRP